MRVIPIAPTGDAGCDEGSGAVPRLDLPLAQGDAAQMRGAANPTESPNPAMCKSCHPAELQAKLEALYTS